MPINRPAQGFSDNLMRSRTDGKGAKPSVTGTDMNNGHTGNNNKLLKNGKTLAAKRQRRCVCNACPSITVDVPKS